jgi:heme/copper-type cytochrome/quinol oxidase subunit 2
VNVFKNILLILVIVGVLFVLVTCAAKNCTVNKPLPDAPQTKYVVIVEVTGNRYYTDRITDQNGIVTLFSYYEMTDGDYILHEVTLSLDRKYFGEIEVKLR